MRNSRALAAVLVALSITVSVTLAGCSSSDTATKSGKAFNNTDVTFATDMIQHHAQALEMVDLTRGHHLDPDVQAMTKEIRAAQTPEIEKMATWLQDWDKPVPATSRDHAHADGGGMAMHTDMPGMMTSTQMKHLAATRGEVFRNLWLQMMITHHQGAIEMAQTEQDGGQNKKAVALADHIAASQDKEITTMKQMLTG